MKLVHLSDLHLGKRLNEFSLLEDQETILGEILNIVDREKPDAVLLAGDLYDKSVPPAEAVTLLDRFLSALAAKAVQVLIISGNHDSPERLAFASSLLAHSGVHVAPVFSGHIRPVTLHDEYGEVRFFLLPFLKPAMVRPFYPETEIGDYNAAYRTVIDDMGLDTGVRNVLLAHAFVTGAERSESEEISVGGADNVDASVFADFDYVALGHLHSPQNIGGERIRYCGSPLKYSFSEVHHVKSMTVAELGEKGELVLRLIPLMPRRDLKELRGNWLELTSKAFYEPLNREDYMHLILTDEEDVPDAVSRLRVIYPNLMKLDYDNRRVRSLGLGDARADSQQKSPLQLFAELYKKQNGSELTREQTAFCEKLMEEIWGEQA